MSRSLGILRLKSKPLWLTQSAGFLNHRLHLAPWHVMWGGFVYRGDGGGGSGGFADENRVDCDDSRHREVVEGQSVGRDQGAGA